MGPDRNSTAKATLTIKCPHTVQNLELIMFIIIDNCLKNLHHKSRCLLAHENPAAHLVHCINEVRKYFEINEGNQAKGERKMTRHGKALVIILCALSFLIATREQGHAANWLFVVEDAGNKTYIDADTIQVNKKMSTIKASIKTTDANRTNFVTLTIFNYKERTLQGLQLTIYFPDGKSERTDRPDKITHIEPNSVGDSILTKLLEITGIK